MIKFKEFLSFIRGKIREMIEFKEFKALRFNNFFYSFLGRSI